MNDSPPPPTPPNPDHEVPQAEDREAFRERLVAQLKERGMSGRQLENRACLPTGTLSKVYKGRIRLTLKLLLEIVGPLSIGPDLLVVGTRFASLLMGAPASEASKATHELEAEVERLRAELAEKTAVAETCARNAAALEERAERAEAQLAEVRVRLEEAEANITILERARDQTAKTATHASMLMTGIQTQLDATKAQLAVYADAFQKWMAHAQDRERRVAYLEGELVNLQQKIAKASAEEGGKLLVTGLATLGLGLALGSGGPRRPPPRSRA
jgi:transcriptional regulator with XRE-family HTH domain